MTITTLHGDCRQILPTMPDRSVQCIVTSPPYYGLRKYSDDAREIGQEAQPDCLAWARREPPCGACYVCAMRDVFAQLWRVLRDDGVVWLNLGDSYAGYWGDKKARAEGRAPASDTNGWTNGFSQNSRPDFHAAFDGTGIKAKDLIGIPWRVALALQADGWYLRSDIVWSKPNCMPESVTDRPTRAHEYVFLLAKSARYFYDAAAITEAVKQSSIDRINQPSFDEQTGGPKDYGATGVNTSRSMRKALENFKQNGSGSRNRRTVWSIATQPYSGAHYATMPEALIEPCILAGSRADDTVLDPFAGSGTVGRVALRLQRRAVLIELNQDYIEQHIEKRTDGLQVEMFV